MRRFSFFTIPVPSARPQYVRDALEGHGPHRTEANTTAWATNLGRRGFRPYRGAQPNRAALSPFSFLDVVSPLQFTPRRAKETPQWRLAVSLALAWLIALLFVEPASRGSPGVGSTAHVWCLALEGVALSICLTARAARRSGPPPYRLSILGFGACESAF